MPNGPRGDLRLEGGIAENPLAYAPPSPMHTSDPEETVIHKRAIVLRTGIALISMRVVFGLWLGLQLSTKVSMALRLCFKRVLPSTVREKIQGFLAPSPPDRRLVASGRVAPTWAL